MPHKPLKGRITVPAFILVCFPVWFIDEFEIKFTIDCYYCAIFYCTTSSQSKSSIQRDHCITVFNLVNWLSESVDLFKIKNYIQREIVFNVGSSSLLCSD